MGKLKKTNAMRILDRYKVAYKTYEYSSGNRKTTMTVAEQNNLDPNRVFKTLVTQGASKEYYVFLVPSTKELNLKKAAKIVGEKKIEMIPQKDLLPLTGYVHGGCSPLGMKKEFKTYINSTVNEDGDLVFSGGRRGTQIEVGVDEFLGATQIKVADICD